MAAEIDGTVVAIASIAALVIILLFKATHKFEKGIRKHSKSVEERVNQIEKEVIEVKTKAEEIAKATDKKIDCAYLDKRIDGLINLIHGKAR